MMITRKKETLPAQPESKRQADWIREHPDIGPSKFPDYPDETARRGASRGAVPNGNPWKPESDQERPGPRWTQSTPSAEKPEVEMPGGDDRTDDRTVDSPPTMPVPVAKVDAILDAKDASIASQIGERLASSKILEGESVDLHVTAGEVGLAGVVATSAARLEAEHVASSVRGVVKVENRIRVEPRSR